MQWTVHTRTLMHTYILLFLPLVVKIPKVKNREKIKGWSDPKKLFCSRVALKCHIIIVIRYVIRCHVSNSVVHRFLLGLFCWYWDLRACLCLFTAALINMFMGGERKHCSTHYFYANQVNLAISLSSVTGCPILSLLLFLSLWTNVTQYHAGYYGTTMLSSEISYRVPECFCWHKNQTTFRAPSYHITGLFQSHACFFLKEKDSILLTCAKIFHFLLTQKNNQTNEH